MQPTRYLRSNVPWLAVGVGFGVAACLSYVGIAWVRYGHAGQPAVSDVTDALLDQVMPECEAAEHHIPVSAPATIIFPAATHLDLAQAAVVQAIFKTRELVPRSRLDGVARPRALLAQMKALGWGVLAEIPGRELVMGAATQPWEANVGMRASSTDPTACAKFRRHWSFFSPGIILIRRIALGLVKKEEESGARTSESVYAEAIWKQ